MRKDKTKVVDEDSAYLKGELALSSGKHVLRKLATCVGEYKAVSILTPILVFLEVICEVLIPLFMAQMINAGTAAQNGATAFDLNLDFGAWSVHLATFDSALLYASFTFFLFIISASKCLRLQIPIAAQNSFILAFAPMPVTDSGPSIPKFLSWYNNLPNSGV